MRSPTNRRSRASLVVLVAAGLIAWRASPSAAEEKYEVDFRTDVVYGKAGDEELKLNLAVPKGLKGPTPGLIYIHGGGWSGGDKKSFDQFAKNAAQAGYVAATIDYRLAPKHQFPAQVEDCQCAVRWMRAHAGELQVDPQRIGAVGGSAGAHLALMLGVMDKDDGLEGEGGWPEQSSKVQAVVSYVGPVNLVGDFPEVSQGILKNFLGGPMDERLELYRRASPITYVNAGDSPMLLYAGTKDQLVPYDQAFQMAKAMTDAEIAGRVEFLIGEGHGFSKPEMERTVVDMLVFLDEQLRKAK